MPLLHVLSDCRLHVTSIASFRRPFGEQRLVDVRTAETTGSTYDYIAILFMPLEHGTRTYAELLAYFGRYRDLALRRNPGLSYRHEGTLPR
jgi:hypothetical protein